MAKTPKAPDDDGVGYRYEIRGMPAQQFKTKPAVGEVWDAHVTVRVVGFAGREMAEGGVRESVKLRVLTVQLVELSEIQDPNQDPNQTTIDDAAQADTDSGDWAPGSDA